MAVKRFQTRIALKADSLFNWEANHDIVLLNGEFAWTGISRPDGSQIRDFKIGDGTSTWKALPFILPVGDGSTIVSGTATQDHAHVLSVGVIGSDKVTSLTNYSSSGVSYAALSTSDSLNTALAKLEAGIASAQTAGVTSFGSATGAITVGNGLQMNSSEVSAKTTGYVVNTAGANSNAIGLDSNQIDSTYVTVDGQTVTVNTPTNLATVATVTAALGTLDVSEFGIGSLYNNINTTSGAYDAIKIADIKEVDGKISTGTGGHVLSIDIDKDHPYIAGTSSGNTYTQGNPLATVATVTAAVNGALDSEVTFQGVASSLPANPANGDMYKVTADVSIPQASAGQGAAVTAHAGDTIIYKGGTGAGVGWYVIPSGDDSFTSTGITLVSGDPGYQDNTSTVSDALQSLATSISSNSAGTLDTTTAAVNTLSTNGSESLHGTVQLHKVSKTGNIAHLGQRDAVGSDGLTNTPDMIILECGSATVNTLS